MTKKRVILTVGTDYADQERISRQLRQEGYEVQQLRVSNHATGLLPGSTIFHYLLLTCQALTNVYGDAAKNYKMQR